MASTHANKYCNHLIKEKSPYLLQHAHNPVDWYPWGEEAFQKAKKENKPIFLSVGYATCHWCHVMEKESFEDEEVAELLNRYFVSIKVDREERPDVDQVYMNVCQAMTGSGGWPLSVFMTPDGKPFFAGTYFPKEGRRGMPCFKDVVIQIGELWKKDREKLFAASENIISVLEKRVRPDESAEKIGLDVLKKAFDHMSIAFDPKWGGFSFPPKFPTPHNYTFLLRWYNRTEEAKVLEMVEKSLTEMRNGGIFDQIGFGFHRYSVDERWLVPHFEKMLYDQALISIAYLDAYLVTKKDRYLQVAEEIFTYVLRDMTSPEGGFYTAEDADSEGREGKFYVWTPKEVKSILGNVRGELFCQFYNISEKGNFEGGYSIPHISKPLKDIAEERKISIDELAKELERGRRKLFEVREKRVHPLKDDKILTSWNGLMIAALARGYRITGNRSYIKAAEDSYCFIMKKMTSSEGLLYRRYREGHVAYQGYLDDYAFLVWGLIELYESTFQVEYLEKALDLTRTMIKFFWDSKNGGFYYSGKHNEELILKNKEIYDGAVPSGNSVAAFDMLWLARVTGEPEFENRAEQLIQVFSAEVSPYPMGYTYLLGVVDFMIGPAREIVLVGDLKKDDSKKMLETVYHRYNPNSVVIFKDTGSTGDRLARTVPFVRDMVPVDGRCTAYVCEKFACRKPVNTEKELESILEK